MKEEKKMAILDRLIKDGSIDLAEALVLLETEKEYINIPALKNPFPFQTTTPDPYTIIGEKSVSIFGETKPLGGFEGDILNKTFKRLLKDKPSII